MADPMVYVAHAISVDRELAAALRSNDVLPHPGARADDRRGQPGPRGSDLVLQRYHCAGLVRISGCSMPPTSTRVLARIAGPRRP